MQISSNFDSGNIEVVKADNPQDIQLEIRRDNRSDFYQWFYFRLSGANQLACTLKILNAAGAAYPDGFKNYRVVYSYDRQQWRRHATQLRDGVLQWQFTAEFDCVYFAYFAPYSIERHLDMLARACQSPVVQQQRLGATLDGQDLDVLKVTADGDAARRKKCWIIARQHPGETMAQWYMEGLLEKLLDNKNALSSKLLHNCVFYLVPNMNPDGSRRGHLRTNAAGMNLNREWQTPSMEKSPEVFLVKQAMDATGVDFFLDVHGDEALPYNFIAGTEGLQDWNSQRQQQLDFYVRSLASLNADFQTEHGYPRKQPGEANLTMSTTQTAQNHGCLAMTLEMPFKDATATPDQEFGWSPPRCKKLAHSCLEALEKYLDSGLL